MPTGDTPLKTVAYERRNRIAIVRFNRPEKLNAQNDRLTRDFLLALEEAARDDQVRAVVLKGEGRAFCSGHDLKEQTGRRSHEEEMAAVERLQNTSRLILGMGKPVIAAIHGYALGAGCEWAMNCDIRIAAEGTKFGFPETSLGSTITNGGTSLLPLLVGLGRAKELAFTNEMIDARKAEEWGLVNKVVPLESLEERAVEMAERMANNPPFAMMLTKEALNRGCTGSLDEALERETRDAVLAAHVPVEDSPKVS